jgi:hypothetical protein
MEPLIIFAAILLGALFITLLQIHFPPPCKWCEAKQAHIRALEEELQTAWELADMEDPEDSQEPNPLPTWVHPEDLDPDTMKPKEDKQ